MARISKEKQLNNMLDRFRKDLSTESFFTYQEIQHYLEEQKEKFGVYKSISLNDFIEFLIAQYVLQEAKVSFPKRTITRYGSLRTDIKYEDVLTLVSTFKSDGFFSHYTAAFLNGLTDNIIKTLYYSQLTSSNNRTSSKLLQKNIDAAFSKPARVTSNVAYYESYKIVLLENSFRDKGVLKLDRFKYTNLEKTLLDITVRPAYSGGVFEVLSIYERARDTISMNRFRSYLKQANYIYPYHQSIGFFMERAGYSDKQIGFLEEFPLEYDFYLAHNIKNTSYSNRWRIYYPSELDQLQ